MFHVKHMAAVSWSGREKSTENVCKKIPLDILDSFTENK